MMSHPPWAQNVKMKVRNPSNWLEGDMWPDDRNPDKVQLKKLYAPDTQEIAALVQRKKKYLSLRSATKQDDKPGESFSNHSQAKISKAEKKRLKRQKRKEERNLKKGHQDSEAEDKLQAQIKPLGFLLGKFLHR